MSARKQKKIKDLLVQYKGGGYDGCFWEWNFFLFDHSGKFHVIFESGRNGIKTEDEARALLKKPRREYRFVSEDYFTYNLTRQKKIREFANETAPTLVAIVTDSVNRIYGQNLMHWQCDECDKKNYTEEMHHDGYVGNGGISVSMQGKLCLDCYLLGVCENCEEYDSGEKTLFESVRGSGIRNDLYVCECCFEYLTENKRDAV